MDCNSRRRERIEAKRHACPDVVSACGGYCSGGRTGLSHDQVWTHELAEKGTRVLLVPRQPGCPDSRRKSRLRLFRFCLCNVETKMRISGCRSFPLETQWTSESPSSGGAPERAFFFV